MKRLFFLFLAGIATFVSVSAQSDLSFTSSMWKRGGVWQDGARIKPAQVREVMSVNSEALQQYNSGMSLFVAGQVIAYPSAFLLGWDLGARIGSGEGNGTLLGIGAAGVVVGFIFYFSGENKMKNSVQLYNSKASDAVSYQINFGFTPTGIGLSMQF